VRHEELATTLPTDAITYEQLLAVLRDLKASGITTAKKQRIILSLIEKIEIFADRLEIHYGLGRSKIEIGRGPRPWPSHTTWHTSPYQGGSINLKVLPDSLGSPALSKYLIGNEIVKALLPLIRREPFPLAAVWCARSCLIPNFIRFF
jgi:hypothetical protein